MDSTAQKEKIARFESSKPDHRLIGMNKTRPIGIMSAISQEIESLLGEMATEKISHHGRRDFHEGSLWGCPCVLVYSRVGKVASAATATELISRFNVERLLITGVAGSASENLKIGDIVIGQSLVQHDMDARPLFRQYEIPYLNVMRFLTDEEDSVKLQSSAQSFLNEDFESVVSKSNGTEFGLSRPKVFHGEIASGDQFIADHKILADLKKRLPDTLCVEMEGAAVAQVCYEYDIPFSLVRIISDGADSQAPVNFVKFVQEVAKEYSHGIIRRWLKQKAGVK